MHSVAVPALDDELARHLLQFLDSGYDRPTLRTLNRLIRAYIHKVPWESVFSSRRQSPLHTFIVAPCGAHRHQIDRTRHPKRHVYVLVDEPVGPDDFSRVMANDYSPAGQFLEHVIIVKMIDGCFWRYNAGENRYRIDSFGVDGMKQVELPPQSLAERLGAYFQMASEKIAEALAHTQR